MASIAGTAANAATRRVERILASPRTVASAFNWQMNLMRPILSVHLGESSIDLALVSHPGGKGMSPCSNNKNSNKSGVGHRKIFASNKEKKKYQNGIVNENPHLIHALPSIALEQETFHNQKQLKSRVLRELSKVVDDNKVCGLVVSWPVQKEGRMGAPCGKVLHALDQIVHDTDIVKASRPVCLWDGHHYVSIEDQFERPINKNATTSLNATTSSSSSKTGDYKASQQQYHDEGMTAAAVAADYLRTHWPDLTLHSFPPSSADDTLEARKQKFSTRKWPRDRSKNSRRASLVEDQFKHSGNKTHKLPPMNTATTSTATFSSSNNNIESAVEEDIKYSFANQSQSKSNSNIEFTIDQDLQYSCEEIKNTDEAESWTEFQSVAKKQDKINNSFSAESVSFSDELDELEAMRWIEGTVSDMEISNPTRSIPNTTESNAQETRSLWIQPVFMQ